MKKLSKILLVAVLVFVVTGCGCEKREVKEGKTAEDTFKEYVVDYYNARWKNDVIVGVREITIETLGKIPDDNGNSKYDVSKIKVGDQMCDAKASMIRITTPDLSKMDDFTVQVFLTCGNYKSQDQKDLDAADTKK